MNLEDKEKLNRKMREWSIGIRNNGEENKNIKEGRDKDDCILECNNWNSYNVFNSYFQYKINKQKRVAIERIDSCYKSFNRAWKLFQR